uniref:Putative secreted protein n=1 Tax=Amblyomma triste TaxID=251400 RepID=A0A023G204_AMBTT
MFRELVTCLAIFVVLSQLSGGAKQNECQNGEEKLIWEPCENKTCVDNKWKTIGCSGDDAPTCLPPPDTKKPLAYPYCCWNLNLCKQKRDKKAEKEAMDKFIKKMDELGLPKPEEDPYAKINSLSSKEE